jgi:hypothetical protein
MENAIKELQLQLNYVCYDEGMILKLDKVWEAFSRLEEAFNSSHNKQSTPCRFEAAHLGMKDGGMVYCSYCGVELSITASGSCRKPPL